MHLDSVTPGGLVDYCQRAKQFLENSKNNVNPFDGFKPEVPTGVNLAPGSPDMDEMEALGLKELKHLGFVLIAGGLGERLGYSGIKVDLPVSTIEDDYFYLKFYVEFAQACKERALAQNKDLNADTFYVPFCIMVSNDTEARTIALLERAKYFGLPKEHFDIVKQENVPALIDNNANIALAENEFKAITKPHGHGDIHTLLFQHGVVKKWLGLGKKWMLFLQDTNALATRTIPSLLGVSAKNDWEMNTVTVGRKPGEPCGAICNLVHETDPSKSMVINVEYN